MITLDENIEFLRKLEELVSTTFLHGYHLARLYCSKPYEQEQYKARQEKMDNARIQSDALLSDLKAELLKVIRL